MCGIIATAGELGPLDLLTATTALEHRGPDGLGTAVVGGVQLGHTRLAVQDVSDASGQPFRYGPITLAYNGECFNTAELRVYLEGWWDSGIPWKTTGDTEVIAAALALLGPAAALPAIDGMFALAWADDREPGVLFVARDRHGEIPLHLHRAQPLVVASELKAFQVLGRRVSGDSVVDIQPGTWCRITDRVDGERYHQQSCEPNEDLTLESAVTPLALALERAVTRRAISDVPVCSLLSGGIDSAAIALELTRHVDDLVCYTAKLNPKSADLRCARETAEMLGVTLVEVPIPVPTADDLSRVIGHIEMDYKAQVEIGWPCLHLAEAMRGDGFKVTYSGEGSDELWASYGFAYHALSRGADWHEYRRDLVAAQARKNFPRVNKAFMAYGVEGRLPFLDPGVVDLALSLRQDAVQDGRSKPKAVLQRAYRDRLPRSVTHRAKVAFQDGLGLKTVIADEVLGDPLRYYRTEHARIFR